MPKLELKDLSPSDLMVPCKKWYQSKTVWFNIATGVVAVTAGLSGVLPILAPVVTEVTMAYILFGVGLINIVLRAVTSTALV